MHKQLIKNILLLVVPLLLNLWQVASAQEPVSAPAGTVSPPSLPDATQFKDWLKNNAQAQIQQQPPQQLQQTQPQPPVVIAPRPAETQKPESVRKLLWRANASNSPVLPSVPPLTYQQSKDAILKATPPSPPPSPDSQAAFDLMLQQNPLTPEQVIRLRQYIDQSQRAAATPATVPPKPVSTTLMINLAPGTTPPAIRLAQGYISSLVFVDSTGAPWPIAAYDIGDPRATNIQWDGKSNILLIQAVLPYGDSDLVIRLVGLATPITLELVSGQRVVDFRTDIHVAGIGPNAKELPTGTELPNSANQLLLNILDGVGPPLSRQLTVTGGDCQAWLLGDKMYLRTRLTVLSPGWIGRMVSSDGMNAYEIQRSSSVLVSQYGEPIELKIEGF